jgi:hypothetical protein
MRWCALCLGCLVLTACNEVTGNERGGMISGVPNSLGLNVEGLWMSDEEALKKASEHCKAFRKTARITSIGFGKTLFECS